MIPSVAAAQPSVTVARPNGGERIYASAPYTIEWTVGGTTSAVRSFDVLVSSNSGVTYTAIAGCSGLGAAMRSCTWAAPAPLTTTGRIRVVAHTTGADVADASNSSFTVASGTGSIKVTAPTTGTTFLIGAHRTISWTHTLGSQARVRVDLSRDGGSSWQTIAPEVTSGTSSGSFSWAVTAPTTSNARIRVAALNTTTTGTSDGSFIVAAPSITVADQPAGSNWGYGTQRRITFTSTVDSSDRLNVKLSTDGGATFPLTLASQVNPSSSAVTVTIPALSARTDAAIVLVESAAAPSIRAVTTTPVTIEPAFIGVIRPNSPGDVWPTNTVRTVAWRDNLGTLESVRLELSRDGGSTFATVLASSTTADGAQSFSVSSAWVTNAARVRASWTRNTAVRDVSDADFPIRTGATNVAPVANAGPDQSVRPGDTVRLNGAASSDADGNTLTYTWTLVSKPTGSAAVLVASTSVSPSFVADREGAYSARLVVSDGVVNSAADTVAIVATANRPPIADAGADRTVNEGQSVTLDGSRSADPDGSALTFTWTLTERPATSNAQLSNASGPAPTFVADVGGRYVAQLVVGDGTLTSAADAVVITANRRPVSNAGPDQTPLVGTTVQLSGAASTDADGQPLTYAWSVQSRPAGSTAVLSDATIVNPTFTVDRAGSYVLVLVVNDGMLASAPASVTLNTANSAPVANAGADQSARVGNTVTLDASSSTDVDGDLLRFAWTLTRPSGSSATLSDSTALNPAFTIDKPGTYVARLIVNDGKAQSDPDTVNVTTINSAPVANAGDDLSARVLDTIVLDGTASSDVDGDLLSFEWALTAVPEGSAAVLDQGDVPRPRFVVDRPGTYVAQLIVRDGTVASTADTVTITTSNSAPVARAGDDYTAYLATTVTIDGGASSDADFDTLQYAWSITSKPAGSSAVLSDPTSAMSTFYVDVAGTYVLQLIVSDGTLSSSPDTVIVTTTNSAPVARAGDDRTGAPGAAVALSGLASTDADADPLTYSWALTSIPAGSASVLSDTAVPEPSFVPDVAGTYIAQLTVNDGAANSEPDTVTITVHPANKTPVAAAGPDQSVNTGVVVQLDGSQSTDPDADPLTYSWTLTTAPAGSAAALSDPSSATPQFSPDQPGDYVFTLTVSDGRATSAADAVTVSVVLPPEFIGTLSASPSTLRFSAIKGGPAPAPQTFTVTVGDALDPAPWVASFSAPWLALSPTAAAGSRDVTVSIDPTGLAAGVYQHTIQIEGPRLQGSPAAISVVLVVDPALSQPTSPEPQTIVVPAGGNIQAAVNAAAPGSTIRLQPGTYVTNVILPAKDNPDGKYITITSDVDLPEGRIDPALKSSLAVLRSPSNVAAIRTNARASYYRLVGLAFDANRNGDGDVITLGDGGPSTQITLEQVPHHLEIDRIIIVGGTTGQKRGIAVNASDVLIQNSDISNLWKNGQDSQAVAGWNTPGAITIRNNRLEAASENILFGGADPAIPNLVPADILIEDNVSTKNLAWRGDTTKEVKNAFELKVGRRVTVRRNIFERVWNEGQDGTAILFKSVNSSGGCRACATEDVLFENNIVRAAGSAINISGYHVNFPSGQTRGITIRNNLFYDISSAYGGNARLVTMGNEPADVVIENNTVMVEGSSIVYVYAGTKMLPDGTKVAGGPITGFRYVNNLAKHSNYGINTPAGIAAKDHALWLPGSVISFNVFAGATTTQAKNYPAGNLFPAVTQFMAQFVDPANQDYALVPDSSYASAASDGGSLGANHALLPPR